jgi:hypothetical protein
MEEREECIIQFVWPGDEEGDYLAHRRMSKAEIEEVHDLLEQAHAQGIIRGQFYIGPLGLSNDPHADFMRDLRSMLDLDEEEDES